MIFIKIVFLKRNGLKSCSWTLVWLLQWWWAPSCLASWMRASFIVQCLYLGRRDFKFDQFLCIWYSWVTVSYLGGTQQTWYYFIPVGFFVADVGRKFTGVELYLVVLIEDFCLRRWEELVFTKWTSSSWLKCGVTVVRGILGFRTVLSG